MHLDRHRVGPQHPVSIEEGPADGQTCRLDVNRTDHGREQHGAKLRHPIPLAGDHRVIGALLSFLLVPEPGELGRVVVGSTEGIAGTVEPERVDDLLSEKRHGVVDLSVDKHVLANETGGRRRRLGAWAGPRKADCRGRPLRHLYGDRLGREGLSVDRHRDRADALGASLTSLQGVPKDELGARPPSYEPYTGRRALADDVEGIECW